MCVHGVCMCWLVIEDVLLSVSRVPEGLYHTALEHAWKLCGLTQSEGRNVSAAQTYKSRDVLPPGCLGKVCVRGGRLVPPGIPPMCNKLAGRNRQSENHKIFKTFRMIGSNLIILHMSIKKLQSDNGICPGPYEKQMLR